MVTRRTGMLALDDLVPAGWIITHVIAISDQEEILATASYLNNHSQRGAGAGGWTARI